MDSSIMTTVLNAVLSIFQSGAGKLQGGGGGLLSVLITIEIVWAGIMIAMNGDSPIKTIFKKIIYVGMFTLLVLNWPSIATIILKGFTWAGTQVGGGANVSIMHNPSAILDQGMRITAPIWIAISEASIMDGEFLINAMSAFVGIAVLVLYFVIAIQVFLAVIEFYIIAAFGVIFIPWGVNQHTKFIAERYFGAILAAGTKLMVTWAMMGVSYPILRSLNLSADPSWSQVISLAFGVGTIAFLIIKAPAIAAGLMSGSANISAGEAMSMGMAGGSMAASGALAAGGAVASATGVGAVVGSAALSGAAALGSSSAGGLKDQITTGDGNGK